MEFELAWPGFKETTGHRKSQVGRLFFVGWLVGVGLFVCFCTALKRESWVVTEESGKK